MTPDRAHFDQTNAVQAAHQVTLGQAFGENPKPRALYLSWRITIEAPWNRVKPEAWIRGAAGLGPYQQTSRQERKSPTATTSESEH